MLGHTSTPTLRTDPHERVFNPFYVDPLIAAPVTDGYEDNDEEDDDVDEDIGEEVGQPPLAPPVALPAAFQLALVNKLRGGPIRPGANERRQLLKRMWLKC
jgi:hypothetical protein